MRSLACWLTGWACWLWRRFSPFFPAMVFCGLQNICLLMCTRGGVMQMSSPLAAGGLLRTSAKRKQAANSRRHKRKRKKVEGSVLRYLTRSA